MCNQILKIFFAITLSACFTTFSFADKENSNRQIDVFNELKLNVDTSNISNQLTRYDSIAKIDIASLVSKNLKKGDVVSFPFFDQKIIELEFQRYETYGTDGLLHWIGSVKGDSKSSVRLTISGDSIFKPTSQGYSTTQLSGIIKTDGQKYYIRPANIEDSHIIYQVNNGESIPLLRFSDKTDLEMRSRWIDAKGLQRDLIADIPNEYYSLGMDGMLTTLKKIPQTRLAGLTIKGKPDISSAIELLSPYIPLLGDETFKLRDKFTYGEETIYDFQQYINGIPVFAHGLRIFVDNDGYVQSIASDSTAVDVGLPAKSVLSEVEAIELARQYMVTTYDKSAVEFTLSKTSSSSVYIVKYLPEIKRREYSLYWVINFDWKSVGSTVIPFQVFVNSVTGDIYLPEKSASFSARVCDGGGQAGITSCPAANVIIDSGVCIASPPSQCKKIEYSTPYNSAANSGAMWEDLLGVGCCDVGKNGKIDIIVNTNIGTDKATYRVKSSSSGSVQYEVIEHDKSTGEPEISDITAHEMGHAIYHKINRTAFLKEGSASIGRESRAIFEAIADINAVIQKNYYHTPRFSNPDWSVDGTTRNIKQQKNYPSDLSVLNSDHTNGLILGHVFYELVAQNNAVNFRTAAQLFLKSIPKIKDSNNNGGISFSEVRAAMLEVSDTVQSLKNAVQNAFADVGIGNPSTIPLSKPPAQVSGIVTTSCDTEDMVSLHNVFWSSVSDVSYYNVWYSPDNFNYIYSFSTTSTIAATYNTVNVDVKVSTCNNENCGILSDSSYYQVYYCLGVQ